MARRSWVGALVGVAAAVGTVSAYNFQITLDSSSLTGQPGKIAFDLTSSDGVQTTINVNAFQFDATLLGTETVGGQTTGGLFQNDPTSGFAMQDFSVEAGRIQQPRFYTSLAVNLTWGTTLGFTLFVPEGGAAEGTPDMFAFYLLDPTSNQPLYATGDPLGASALFAVATDASGACMFLPGTSTVPVSVTVLSEAGEPFNACVAGAIGLGKSKIKFGKKPGKDAFTMTGKFESTVALDPVAVAARFALLQSGVEVFSASEVALKGNKKGTRYAGSGSGLTKLKLASKDQVRWTVNAKGAKADLGMFDTGAGEPVAVRLGTRTKASQSGFSPSGPATFSGSGEFRRGKRNLTHP